MLLDTRRQDLEIFHACGSIGRRGDREFIGIEWAVRSIENTKKERWSGLAVDFVGCRRLESHGGQESG